MAAVGDAGLREGRPGLPRGGLIRPVIDDEASLADELRGLVGRPVDLEDVVPSGRPSSR